MLFVCIDVLCLNNRAKKITDRGYDIDLALLRDAFFMIKCGILIVNLKIIGLYLNRYKHVMHVILITTIDFESMVMISHLL